LKSRFFLLFSLDDRGIRIQEAQKHVDPVDLDPDPDPEHCSLMNTFVCRRSLLLELQSTKEVLLSSLNKVQDLELESQKVPGLESRIQDLERRIAAKK
jgi:hypothetical protein